MENQFTKPKDLTRRKYFDVLDGALACIMFIVLQCVLAVVIGLVGISNRFAYTIFSCLMQLCFVGGVFVVAKFRNVDWIEAGNYNKKIDAKTLLYVAGFTAICLILFTDITTAFTAMLQKIGYSSPLETGKVAEYNQITNIWEYLASIITVCIIPPLCEETLFRGAMLNSFRGINKWVGIISSGFAFMLMHGNPDQTIYQFALGITLGYIAWETNNIWIGVLIHGANNLVAITMQWIYSSIEIGGDAGESATDMVSWGDIAYYAIFGIISCIIAGWLIKVLTDKLKKHLNAMKSPTTTVEGHQSSMVINQDGKVYEMSTTTQEHDSNITEIEVGEEEHQQKTDKKKLIITILIYVMFGAYFLVEWINNLLIGLSL